MPPNEQAGQRRAQVRGPARRSSRAARRDQDDRGDERQVAVGQHEPGDVELHLRRRQRVPHRVGGEVEVDPPQPAAEHERRGDREPCATVRSPDVGGRADGDDRLPQRDQHEQAEALGQVPGVVAACTRSRRRRMRRRRRGRPAPRRPTRTSRRRRARARRRSASAR